MINSSTVDKLRQKEEFLWINPDKQIYSGDAFSKFSLEDIDDAEARLSRFAPFIAKVFPETKKDNGIIESELTLIDNMKNVLNTRCNSSIKGNLYIKQDNALAIAGSVKARGGIYEVLKHTEKLALKLELINSGDCYDKLASETNRKIFSQYTVQVGSTGNLGMSIGIISAAIGYKVVVHMSADAKQWKKDLLRSKGVNVIEYKSDYCEAVRQGRLQSCEDANSYFVDDENSRDLFLGYAVAAKRLKKQLDEQDVLIDNLHPLFVYIPCGIGGAPGGITFGLKQIFGDAVHCFFVEPVNTPCMLLGMATKLYSKISVSDIGLSGFTHADGLAVPRPSSFVGEMMKNVLSGIFTVNDTNLYEYLWELKSSENIFIEPSACAAFNGSATISNCREGKEYIKKCSVSEDSITHIAWATGGELVPQVVRDAYINVHLKK